jgi:ubiquinone/menaquinone biosynthesis C-methylase UbiE
MAFHLDAILNQYERTTKIADYRRALVEYCEGEVLETCVGTSRNGKYYKPGTEVTFLDWSPNMIEVAISKTYPFINPKFVVGNVKAMTFPDNKFDTVIDTFGLEYVDEPEKAL